MIDDISRFLDNNRIKIWPSKKAMKYEILKYLSTKFEYGQFYNEKEVNSIIESWHTFDDFFLLRRGLIDCGFLSRTQNGARYWRDELEALSPVTQVILRNYNIGAILSMSQLNNGIGSNSYYIHSDKGEFIFKDIELNHMNYPEGEDVILCALKDDGIPVPQICKTIDGNSVLCEGEKKYHMQTFIDGRIYQHNTAPDWLFIESAELLGRIQNSLGKLKPLPLGLNKSFFDHFTPEVAIQNHTNTLKIAKDNKDNDIAEIIEDKIKLIERHKDLIFDFSRMTCKNTHGDYSINQIICGKDRINAVIDFTSACVHPICWEVIRSYLLADEACKNGEFNADNFKRYLDHYHKYGSLNDYDIQVMPSFYMYQHLIGDYFYQYYQSKYKNKKLLLSSAILTYKHCKTLSDLVEKDIMLV